MGLDRLWRALGRIFSGLSVAALAVAATGSRTAAWGLVAAAVALAGARLGVAVTEYRRTMRRPWPRVAPLVDDWDD